MKLTEARVDELVSSGRAVAFAPAGRRFREWAAVPGGSDDWQVLLDQALQAATERPPGRRRRTTRWI